MGQIRLNNEVVAIFHKVNEWKEGLDFLTANESFIQAGTWWYPKDKDLCSHKHIVNKRIAEITQEVIVVVSGKVRVDLYNEDSKIFHQEELVIGDVGIILSVGHGYHILEDNTKVVEVKNGPFVSVEKDKVLLDS
ncbi:MAG: hypothetical protein KKD05_02550 [Candidatus Omnitrophica bacterium]|nr:hypothetical protein [Candidatus Omnitrophota bacterium]